MKKLIMVLLCGAILITSAYASGVASLEINQTIQIGEDLYCSFHADNENGEVLTNITADNLQLELGGQILDLDVQSSNDVGIGYVFAVDISASLTQDQFSAVREQMKAIAAALGERDQIAIVSFGTNITAVSDFTGNKNTINAVIDGLSPVDDYTALYGGVMRAIDIAMRQSDVLPVRRAVIVISDGLNTVDDGTSLQEMRDKAVEAGIPLFVAGIQGDGNGSSLAALGEMARASGGTIFTGTRDELPSCMERLNSYIRSCVVTHAKVPAELTDGNKKGLILTLSSGGVSTTDSTDLRLKAFPVPTEIIETTNTPIPTDDIEPTELPTETEFPVEGVEGIIDVEPSAENALTDSVENDIYFFDSDFFKEYSLYIYMQERAS